MPVVGDAELMWSRQNSSANLSDNSKKLTLSFSQCYQVFTTPNTDILEVYNAPKIPAAGSTYPGLPPYVYAQQARPRRVSPTYWLVDVAYEGEVSFKSGQGSSSIGSPFDARPRVRWGVTEVEREVDEDWNGNRITNSVGEPLTARVKFFERVATVTRNMQFWNHYSFSAYDFAVNSDHFMGWPPGTARVKVEAQNVYADTPYGGYWTVTGYFEFRRPYRTTADKAWYSRIRNDGYYNKVDVFFPLIGYLPKIVQAVDDNKVPVTKPVQLDENGYRLTNGTATWLEFQHFESLPFAALGLL